MLLPRLLPASLLLGLTALAACQSQTATTTAAAPTAATLTPEASAPAAAEAISAATIGRYLQAVSADEMLGRKPFTAGEERSTQYLADEFRRLGLQPGPGGSYFQPVPLVEITGTPAPTLLVKGKGQPLSLQYKTDFVSFTQREQPQVSVSNSPLVFAGYGVVAPEYGWDDYRGLDVKGKTVVVLVNDPGNAGQDTTLFKGKAMTYYGRWTYKYEEAARHGAAGVLIVHDTKPAAYPWSVVLSGAISPKLRAQTDNKGADKCALEGWLTLDAAKKLFQAAGLSYEQLYTAANTRGFRPRPLGGLTLSGSIQNKLRRQTSRNVLAVLPGTTRPGEYIIYSAHWDHFGVGKAIAGDSIYNGAVDDGTGLAALLSIAEAFQKAPQKPERSIVFLAVTAEEQGLLGSAYYAQHPPYPLNKTVADLNMDMLWPYGQMKDLTVIGYGQSELEDYARAAAREQDRYILPDQQPETGMFYRSDHFNFAHVGVPSLYASGGFESRTGGKEAIAQQRQNYTTNMYHKPADQFDPSWDLSGIAQDAQLYFRVGQRLAAETTFPQWRAGSEFKGARDKSMGGK
ncbi:Zn-dependent M28 family amino/carboxypeptidase [Hymenobacter luteus]|uniref:Zn-dependent M28 family amino/carboxypeptidase n=2 Tax=Hymenobacter TaxID=89966 RepID=A0A7W9T1F6_9BACT|nr:MULTISPECIES: M28 family metallopeptidase [Hymenobacter]MBB4601735.1 Zn-dependent M28 family amino/carboxypeptidase [Hymenobacter latericoloratus]MBB6059836.1 Zn-dependent M28 family amino/carboxypeptidase [Hymenobacter luteus]